MVSSVQQPARRALLLGSGDAGALVGGFVVRECDELSGKKAPFVSVEVEGSALHRLHTDRAEIEKVEELLEFARFAVQAIQMPHEHSSRLGCLESSEQLLVGGACAILVGGNGFVDELDRPRVAQPGCQGSAVGSLLLSSGVFAGTVR